MTYFDDCNTVEEIKAKYRTLARENHPDLGGDTETMQRINAAYEAALKSIDGQETIGSDGKKHRYQYNEEVERAIMKKVSELLKIDGIEIYVIGTWIWIMGNTKPVKDELKALGCLWHSKRKVWFWRDNANKGYRSSNGNLEDLAKKYGCEKAEDLKKKKRKAIAS
mgnify:CR=1 FL=1